MIYFSKSSVSLLILNKLGKDFRQKLETKFLNNLLFKNIQRKRQTCARVRSKTTYLFYSLLDPVDWFRIY